MVCIIYIHTKYIHTKRDFRYILYINSTNKVILYIFYYHLCVYIHSIHEDTLYILYFHSCMYTHSIYTLHIVFSFMYVYTLHIHSTYCIFIHVCIYIAYTTISSTYFIHTRHIYVYTYLHVYTYMNVYTICRCAQQILYLLYIYTLHILSSFTCILHILCIYTVYAKMYILCIYIVYAHINDVLCI